jgi:hypothetical protein
VGSSGERPDLVKIKFTLSQSGRLCSMLNSACHLPGRITQVSGSGKPKSN